MQVFASSLRTILLFSFGAAAALLLFPSDLAAQQPVEADSGIVVSAEAHASLAGKEILKEGGNAVDAAVATGFALAVTYPAAGNIGGGGFMVIRLPDGEATTFDYREKAPLAADRDMYLDEEGEPVDTLSRRGHKASGVPGTVAGLVQAHEAYGSLPFERLLQPAIDLAQDGFPINQFEANQLNRYQDQFERYESTRRYFVKPEGERFRAGEVLVQEDLAAALRRIQADGRDGFYRGETADLIVAEMERGNGIITHEDLERYEAVEREPIISSYRDHRIIGMPPPSSGGIAVAQLLNAMEPHDIENMGFGSSETIHLMAEAMRRVYADRAEWLGDQDFVDVPVQGLLRKEYMRERMASFNPYTALASDDVEHGDPMAWEGEETTHYSVVDHDGMGVSVTTTLNLSYGSRVVVDGAGFFMNNEMDDFSVKPGHPNVFGLVGAEANAIEPEKRMLSSMSPTIVEDPEGRLMQVIGTPGGATIITQVFQVILNTIDHGMNIQKAIDAPRIHHQWLPDNLRYEKYGLPADVKRNLRMRGWEFSQRETWGRFEGIKVRYLDEDEYDRPFVYHGATDTRAEGKVAGY